MPTAVAAWDVLSKAANLAQLSAVLATVLTSLLRMYHCNRRECASLELCHRRLHALLQWPATCSGTALLPCSETAGDPFGEALGDAAGLVESYQKSTLWRRVRSSRRIATQLREMQDVIDLYCGLLLFVNTHLLLQQQAAHNHDPIPPSSDTSNN